MVKQLRYTALLLVLFINPQHIFAWGAEGHGITGEIGYQYMAPNVKDSVNYYLDNMDMAAAANWMDNIRSDSKYDYLKPLHYINIDKGQSYNPDSTHNIVGELNTVIEQLKNRSHYSKEQNAMNIKILMHLMGDLHQPLHVGYGVDEGGNFIMVKFLGWISNLHKVWDTDIIVQDNINYKTCYKLAQKLVKTEDGKLTRGTVVDWLNDSRSHLVQVYDFRQPTVDVSYMLKNAELIERQLAVAGIRMGFLLNEIFNGNGQ